MAKLWEYVYATLMYLPTGNELIDDFIYYSSFFLEFAAAFGVAGLVLFNKPVRKRLRPQDRLIFWECVLVFSQNVLDISLVPLAIWVQQHLSRMGTRALRD